MQWFLRVPTYNWDVFGLRWCTITPISRSSCMKYFETLWKLDWKTARATANSIQKLILLIPCASYNYIMTGRTRLKNFDSISCRIKPHFDNVINARHNWSRKITSTVSADRIIQVRDYINNKLFFALLYTSGILHHASRRSQIGLWFIQRLSSDTYFSRQTVLQRHAN